VNLLTLFRGDTELPGGFAIPPRKLLNASKEGRGCPNLRNYDL
jgi:hypothetical protein